MIRIAILDDYQNVALRMADWSNLDAEIVSIGSHIGDLNVASESLKYFDVLVTMRERMPFPRALFERLPRLKLLALTGPWAANLDVQAAKDNGVVVVGTQGNIGDDVYSTPELTWALILAVARNLGREDRNLRAGGWQRTSGMLLRGRTLGIVGLGRVGSIIADYARAFGMKVIAWSPNLTSERARAAGVERVEKAELFARADVVSLHLILSDSTRDVVGRDELARMGAHSILINTARAQLIDEAALVETLQAGRIGGAGLDVFWQEPLPPDHPLLALETVQLTPHLGYVTEEHYRVFYGQTVENIAAFLAGDPIRVIETGPLLTPTA